MKCQSPLVRHATLDGEDVQLPAGMRIRDRHVPNRPFGMYPQGDQLERLGKAIMSTVTLSAAARSVGCDRKTATKLFKILLAQRQRMGLGDILCKCGRTLVHKGQCEPRRQERGSWKNRLQHSEAKQRFGSITDDKVPVELRNKWNARLADWKRLNVQLAGADFAQEVLEDLEKAVAGALERPVTLLEASAIGGYSVDHLAHMVKTGRIVNVGERGRPRIRRRDVPVKGDVAA